jgi:CubicO group peptidase (beta-lactamase class C family)
MKKEKRFVSYNLIRRNLFQPAGQVLIVSVFCIAMFLQTSAVKAELPVSGVEVPELAIFDIFMQSYMEDNDIQAGILAISKDGCVVYQRGFGYAYNGSDPLPENTPMRLASVEKPHTAAVIRHLVANGVISLNDFVFNVGQSTPMGERRLLDASSPSSTYYPYNGVYGNWGYLAAVRVNDLLNHRGGWDRELAPDPFGQLLHIGDVTHTYPALPPTREDIVRYMMSQPMQFDPNDPVACDRDPITNDCLGTPAPCYCDPYSNYGYMLLSLIIEQETGQQHTEMIRQLVQTPEIWVPSTEVFLGRDFRAQQNQREPHYVNDYNCKNLHDPCNIYYPWDDVTVPCPYGGLLMEDKTGEGNLVGSAAPLLIFLDNYRASGFNLVGMPISSPVNGRKNGGLDGTSTRIQQRDDGFNVVVLFAQGGGHADEVVPQVFDLIDWATGIDWSSLSCIDGFWVDFNAYSSGFGGYDDPFHTMNDTLSAITDGTKLRFKEGTSNWTGTISTRTLLNAPFGTAIIGQ